MMPIALAAAVIEMAPNPVMVISYWGYVAFLPVFIVAFVIHGWLIRPKR
jgi:hypothetical protein